MSVLTQVPENNSNNLLNQFLKKTEVVINIPPEIKVKKEEVDNENKK